MKNPTHQQQILRAIKDLSGTPTQHTFSDEYLGNSHKRYPISAPVLRKIGKAWYLENRQMPANEFAAVLTDLIHGESSTEKMMAGILLDYSRTLQQGFDLMLFDEWLDHLIGWAEVDSICTNSYATSAIPADPKKWRKLLTKLSRSKNINKRRAAIVFLCSPLRNYKHDELTTLGLEIIERLKREKEILITKAISWLLRSMVKHNRKLMEAYLKKNMDTLPRIAVRETMTKLTTGRKGKVAGNKNQQINKSTDQ